ncbi:fibrobacter succinogenes major paralogous domain-containing protein [Algoriphagus sp.]|uniref:fibrobacter succinogenes major paralogous domain-containing protein n=1 Tax=Algoriphagus sp. TaxID=1872435 RepID=UPI002724AAA0|nr:fibrobacter succinogenes major paralogous domain-containing protein [Algoriphagus sp.]MDO8967521.1 fibrobacter succinogenes major paralogous domain-containing protein [Algoriphagus sp.]MDP3201831.1 fibrobacter succinogenes major paralogous domain-containing protein [Algoriphagus sp.]
MKLLLYICFLFSFLPLLAQQKTPISPSKSSIDVKLKDSIDVNLKPVYDLDSNRYEVIKIGNQYWFKENLRTTQYRDTTRIASGLNAQEWKETKRGAYAVYEDNPRNRQKFGLLYNGYAAVSGKLCPLGWHVATDKDWNELEKFLGIPVSELERTGERGEIAPKLKVSEGWKASSFSGDNSSRLGILPAGSRLDNGEYTTLGQYGNFWTSTVYDDRYGLLYLWNHHVHYNTNAVGRIYTLATNGYSCRCVKDPEKPQSKPAKK